MATDRANVAGYFGLDMDGINAGVISKVSGGFVSADVITETVGVTSYQQKHLGNKKYDPIKFSVGPAMSKGFYDWMKASFDMNYQRKNGAIVNCDFNYKETSRLTFFNALIQSIGFPALDATSNNPAAIDLTVGIEKSTYQSTPAGSISGKYPTFNDKTKRWTCSNFRLKIDGLDDVCKAVTNIDAITLQQTTAVNQVGELRDIQIEPASIQVPDLVITFNANKADGALAWWQDFVENGNCDETKEKSGTLEFLTTDLKSTMFTLNFHHLGVYKIDDDPQDVGSEKLRKMKMTMYCEHIDFNYNTQFVGA